MNSETNKGERNTNSSSSSSSNNKSLWGGRIDEIKIQWVLLLEKEVPSNEWAGIFHFSTMYSGPISEAGQKKFNLNNNS